MKRSIAAAALFALSSLVHAGQTVQLRDLIVDNSNRIQQLKNGMSRDEAVKLMRDDVARIPGGTVGNPYKSKTLQQGGASYEVLYYLTQLPTQGKEALTTPVVFKNGVLSGMGVEAVRALKQ